MSALTLLFKHRRLLWALVRREVTNRYSGTALGLLWLLLYPLFFLSIYSVVFLYIFKVQAPSGQQSEYILRIYAALVPFLAVAETLGSATPSIVANKDVVTGTLFPSELVPIRYVGASMAVLAVGYLAVLVGAWWNGIVHPSQLLIPVIMAMQFVFMVGIAWLCATVYVFFRDFGQIIPLVIIVLMMVSPIAFDRAMLPQELVLISAVNPLFPFMELYRGVTISGVVNLQEFAACAAIAAGFFLAGHFVFSRLKVAFGDYL